MRKKRASRRLPVTFVGGHPLHKLIVSVAPRLRRPRATSIAQKIVRREFNLKLFSKLQCEHKQANRLQELIHLQLVRGRTHTPDGKVSGSPEGSQS
jgi:hypothetical protein